MNRAVPVHVFGKIDVVGCLFEIDLFAVGHQYTVFQRHLLVDPGTNIEAHVDFVLVAVCRRIGIDPFTRNLREIVNLVPQPDGREGLAKVGDRLGEGNISSPGIRPVPGVYSDQLVFVKDASTAVSA